MRMINRQNGNFIRMFLQYISGVLKLFALGILIATKYLPLSWRYAMTDTLAFTAFLLMPRKRRAVRKNLSLIFSRHASRREILKVFLEYGRYWAELPGLSQFWRQSSKTYEGVFPPAEKCFLGITFHVGNFEIFGHEVHRARNSDITVIAEHLEPDFLARCFGSIRSRHHFRTIAHDNVRGILRLLRSGNALGIVADRLIAGQGTETVLFGKKVQMPLNLVEQALQLSIPIVIAYCVKERDGLRIVTHRMEQDVTFDYAIKTISEILESVLRKYPYQWHMLSPISEVS